MELKVGHQIYLNSKFFLDVIEIDKKITVRIKYKEGDFFHYKNIDLPLSLFKNCKGNDNFGLIYCNISAVELKKHIGGLVNKMIKEPNVYELFENATSAVGANTSGMGAVSNPGLSGVPGTPGTMGSGDVSTHFDFGLQKLPIGNKKHIDVLLKGKKKKKNKIKEPILNIINLKENIEIDIESETDYKLQLFTFLDYPYNNDQDAEIIDSISKHREEFTIISSERIKTYLNLFYDLNKTFILANASEELINKLEVLKNK